MRSTLTGLILMILSTGLVACGPGESRSVKARPIAPIALEARALNVLRMGSAFTALSTGPTHLNALDPLIVGISRTQISGVRLQLQAIPGFNEVQIQVEMIENLFGGCEQSVFRSNSVPEDSLDFDWTYLSGGEVKIQCLEANCTHILLVVDRLTSGDPLNPITQGVFAQAGSAILVRDPNNENPGPGITQYIPMVTRDQQYFLDPNDTDYERQVCMATYGGFAGDPVNPAAPGAGVIPPGGWQTPYYEPFPNNTVF